MSNIKRVAIFLALFAVTIVIAVGFKGNDVMKRAVILGVGVDSCPDGVEVTAEIVSPGNGSEEVGMFSKTSSATGKTVGEALQNLSAKTGKEVSLGQCVLLVLGEELCRSDFADVLDFFVKSNSFKESAAICCSKGSAKQLLNSTDELSQSVSLSLSQKLNGTSKDVALPACNLLTFARSQLELYRTGFLNFVRLEPTGTDSKNPSKQQGYFVCDRVAVFGEHRLVDILTEGETQGLALLTDGVLGNTFAVSDGQRQVTLRTNHKKVEKSTQDGVVFSVELDVALARTDSFGSGGLFTTKTQTLSKQMLDSVRQQALELAEAFLAKQSALDVDLVGIHEAFRQRYGGTSWVKSFSMQQMPVTVQISVKEK